MFKSIKIFSFAVVMICGLTLHAQDTKKAGLGPYSFFSPTNVGLEFQWYPAGIIPGIEADWVLTKNLTLNTRIGMNIADRQDFSKFHDHEEGKAFGGSLGVRYYLSDLHYHRSFIGLRTDIWDMTIDWTNFGPPEQKGSTDILIVQPTIELGYLHTIGNSPWNVGVALALGFEINVKTEGEEVAQGRVSLLSLHFNRRFLR